MGVPSELPDEDLLLSADPEDFGRFYDRHVHAVIGCISRRTSHPELAADLTAETFAAALVARRRYRIGSTPPIAWLFGIARHKLIDANRRSGARQRLQQRLGMERIPLEEHDRELIEALGREVACPPREEAAAVTTHVLDDRPFDEIAARDTSDFVSNLRAELVAAAQREERRRLPQLPSLRPLIPVVCGAALIAAALVLLLPPAHHQQVAKPHDQAKPLVGGTVDAGVRYRTAGFFVPLQLTFPDRRWIAESTGPDLLAFRRQRMPLVADPDRPPLGFLWFDENTAPVYDPGISNLANSLTPAPKRMLRWLREHPDIDAQAPRRTTVAGHEARVMDVTVRFKHPTHPALQCEGVPTQCTALGPGDNAHPNGARMRVWEIGTRRGRLYVVVEGYDEADFRAVAEAAQHLLEHLNIEN